MEFRANTFDIPGVDKFRAEVMFLPIFSIRLRLAIAPPDTSTVRFTTSDRTAPYKLENVDLVRIDSEGGLSWSAPAAVDPATARIYSDAIALASEMAEHLSTWRAHFEALEMISDRSEEAPSRFSPGSS